MTSVALEQGLLRGASNFSNNKVIICIYNRLLLNIL